MGGFWGNGDSQLWELDWGNGGFPVMGISQGNGGGPPTDHGTLTLTVRTLVSEA